MRFAVVVRVIAAAMSTRRPAAVFERQSAPDSRPAVVVRQTRSQRVRLVHRSQEPARVSQVRGFGCKSRVDGVIEPDPAESVVEKPRQPEIRDLRNVSLDLHAVGFPFVEAGVRVEPGIREERGMGRVVADTVIAGDADVHDARDRLRHAELELVFLDGAHRRQRSSDLGNEARQAGAAREHVFDRRRNVEVVVRPEQHRPDGKRYAAFTRGLTCDSEIARL